MADELDKLVRELLMRLSEEQKLDENKESSQPIDTARKGPDHLEEELEKLPWESLLGATGFLESMEQKLDETINSIEGSKSTSNCNSPLRLNADFWNDPMFEGFDEGKAISTDAIWPVLVLIVVLGLVRVILLFVKIPITLIFLVLLGLVVVVVVNW